MDWEDEDEAIPEEWERIEYDFRVAEQPVRTVVMHCQGHVEFFGLGCWPLAPLEWNLPPGRS